VFLDRRQTTDSLVVGVGFIIGGDEATDRINNFQVDRLSNLVSKFAKGGTRIAILGLSYKPHTPVVEESHSVKLAAKLADAGYIVTVHDPLAQDAALAVLGDKVVGASSIEGAVRECDLLIVATGWPQYKEISPDWCRREGQRLTVLDLWRTLPADEFEAVADLLYLGSGR